MNPMNEDLYIQRLKSIRQKYGCPSSHAQPPTPVQNTTQYYSNANTPQRYKEKAVEQSPKITIEAKIPSRNERSYSQVERSIVLPEPSYDQGEQICQRRMKNYDALIQDLNERIEAKQRALSTKFTNSERLEKREQSGQFRETFSRYGGKETEKGAIIRQTYDRSIEKRQETNTRRLSEIEMQEILAKKWAKETYAERQPIYDQPEYTSKVNHYVSSPYRSKNENSATNNENLSIGKLDNIQQRIKSILKQANY